MTYNCLICYKSVELKSGRWAISRGVKKTSKGKIETSDTVGSTLAKFLGMSPLLFHYVENGYFCQFCITFLQYLPKELRKINESRIAALKHKILRSATQSDMDYIHSDETKKENDNLATIRLAVLIDIGEILCGELSLPTLNSTGVMTFVDKDILRLMILKPNPGGTPHQQEFTCINFIGTKVDSKIQIKSCENNTVSTSTLAKAAELIAKKMNSNAEKQVDNDRKRKAVVKQVIPPKMIKCEPETKIIKPLEKEKKTYKGKIPVREKPKKENLLSGDTNVIKVVDENISKVKEKLKEIEVITLEGDSEKIVSPPKRTLPLSIKTLKKIKIDPKLSMKAFVSLKPCNYGTIMAALKGKMAEKKEIPGTKVTKSKLSKPRINKLAETRIHSTIPLFS